MDRFTNLPPSAHEPASLFPRTCAYVIDSMILMAMFALLGFRSWVFVLFWGIVTFSEASSWQGSPGKRLMGLKVLAPDGKPKQSAVIRNLTKVASHFFYFGFLLAFVNRRRRTLHDAVAETIVTTQPALEVSAGRRAIFFSLISAALFLFTAGIVFQRARPYMSSDGLSKLIKDWNRAEIDPAEARSLLAQQHGVTIPAGYDVVRAARESFGQSFNTKILLAPHPLDIHQGRFSIARVVEVTKESGSFLFILLDMPQAQPLSVIKDELTRLSTKQQTVRHTTEGQEINSVRYFIAQDSDEKVVFVTATSDLVLVSIGPADHFDLGGYIALAKQLQK